MACNTVEILSSHYLLTKMLFTEAETCLVGKLTYIFPAAKLNFCHGAALICLRSRTFDFGILQLLIPKQIFNTASRQLCVVSRAEVVRNSL